MRGTIYDRDMKPQAFNLPCDSLYASPRQIKDKEKAIQALREVLGLDYGYLKNRLSKDKGFVWVSRKLAPEKVRAIKSLKLKGLDFIRESKRCYPNNLLASQEIGFAGLDNTGLEGIELAYNDYLKGEPGWAQVLRDSRQKRLLWDKIILPKDGADIVLTIDEFIQFVAERELERAYKTFRAKGPRLL